MKRLGALASPGSNAHHAAIIKLEEAQAKSFSEVKDVYAGSLLTVADGLAGLVTWPYPGDYAEVMKRRSTCATACRHLQNVAFTARWKHLDQGPLNCYRLQPTHRTS